MKGSTDANSKCPQLLFGPWEERNEGREGREGREGGKEGREKS